MLEQMSREGAFVGASRRSLALSERSELATDGWRRQGTRCLCGWSPRERCADSIREAQASSVRNGYAHKHQAAAASSYAFPSRIIANITHNTRRATATIAFFSEPVFRFSFSNTVRQRR